MKRLNLLPLIALLASCSGSIDPVEPPSELVGFKPQLALHSRWQRTAGQGTGGQYLKLSPLLEGDRLFVADRYGRVTAYNSLSGERLWQRELERTISAGPGYAPGLLLFGGDAEVFALDMQDGAPRWRSTLGSEVLSAPVSFGDIIVVHAIDGSISALSREDGHQLWRHLERVPSLTLHGTARPLIVGGSIVVIGNAGGEVVALNLQDGALLWRATIATPRGRTDLELMVDVDAELAEADGVIYAAAYQGSVAAINAANGQLLWTHELSSQSGIVLDELALYLSDEAGDVWALSRQNGATLWKQSALHRRALSAPAMQGRYLIVGDYDGYLHWLNKEDGQLVARTRVGNFQEHFPVQDDSFNGRYVEERALLVSPLVEGTRVYGFDKRGVVDAYEVSVIKATE